MEKKPVVKTDEERAAAKAMAETTLRQLYDKIKALTENTVEPFIPMPDVEPSGVLVSSGSRNKFYASGTKINTTMPKLVNDVMDVLAKTMVRLEEVLKAKTTPATDKERNEKTMEYMELIAQNALKLPKVVGKRTCRKN